MAATSTLVSDFTTQNGFTGWGTNAVLGSNGTVVLTPTSTYAGAITSQVRYDLTSSSFMAQLVSPPNRGTGTTETRITIEASVNNSIDFGWTDNTLYCREVINGTADPTYPGYTATQDKYLRVRHDGTSVVWETSPDGMTGWVTRRVPKVPTIPVTSVSIQLISGYYGTEPTPGTAVWDNVNTIGDPGSGYLLMESGDRFEVEGATDDYLLDTFEATATVAPRIREMSKWR